MKDGIKQAVVIILISVIAAFGVNYFSSNGIAYVGNWPSVSGSDSIAVPPSADEGDPPFISLDEAAAKYQSSDIVFIDARDPEDFDYAHIKGAISIPYDYLEDYWKAESTGIPKNNEIVIYCSGAECESSLFLGREMVYQGYTNIMVFYGGWREWERAGLPIETDGNN